MDDNFNDPSPEERQEAQRQRSAENLRRQMRALTSDEIEQRIRDMVGDWLGVDLNTNEGRQRIRDRSAWFGNRFEKREDREDAERWMVEQYKKREELAELERWTRSMKSAFGGTTKMICTTILGGVLSMIGTYVWQHWK